MCFVLHACKLGQLACASNQDATIDYFKIIRYNMNVYRNYNLLAVNDNQKQAMPNLD